MCAVLYTNMVIGCNAYPHESVLVPLKPYKSKERGVHTESTFTRSTRTRANLREQLLPNQLFASSVLFVINSHKIIPHDAMM